MGNPTILAVQKRLKELGYNPGPLDGDYGPRTVAAVRAFQFKAGVTRPDGRPLQFPGSIGSSTLKALGIDEAKPTVSPPWITEADRVLGLHEKHHKRDLRNFLTADGRTVGDPQTYPWCGDFVETCIRLALPSESIPANPYGARNWLKFGSECGPVYGAVAVFWRVKKDGWQGHVGFLAGEAPNQGLLYVLGGNQSNSVSIAALKSNRLLGYRWPKGYPMSAGTAPIGHQEVAVSVDER